MPTVYIHGLYGGDVAIRAFREELKRIIADVKALHLAVKDIDVYILHEYCPDPTNITVEIRGVRAETTLEVQNDLAKTVHDAVRAFLRTKERLEHYTDVDRVSVFVTTFDPDEQGYASTTVRFTRLSLV